MAKAIGKEGEEHECVECHEKKGRDGFFKKQWKLQDGGRCKPCWDSYHKSLEKQHQKQAKRNVAQAGTGTFQQSEPKRQKQEHLCKTCNVLCSKRAFGLCKSCSERQEYFMTYGVGYSMGDAVKSAKIPKDLHSLVGKYRIIFYESIQGCEPETEEISRTAKGTMHLSLREWKGAPALSGNLEVRGDETALGEEMPYCSLIEDVTGTNKSRSFHVKLAHYDMDEDDSDEEDMDEDEDKPSQGTLTVFEKRVAIPYHPDQLYQSHYRPNEDAGVRDPKDLSDAEDMLAEYRDGSNSWMCKHLPEISPDIAFRIREFVTPPPVFFFEKGDLVLEMEMRHAPEYNKVVVCRKEEP